MQQIVWTPKNLAVGIYYFRLKAEGMDKNGKAVKTK
jgi:hypothetical protein